VILTALPHPVNLPKKDPVMNLTRIALAAAGGFVAYFAAGGLAFAIFPLRGEFQKYPAVYREQQEIMKHMPAGMAAMFLAILALSVIYAMLYHDGRGLWQAAIFGAMIGVYSVGSFVVHNYVNLNIGLTLTLQQAVAYFLEWTLTGFVIGVIYRPA
jgi:hypothetical protein